MGERDWEKDRINDVLENRRVPEDPVIIFFFFLSFFKSTHVIEKWGNNEATSW